VSVPSLMRARKVTRTASRLREAVAPEAAEQSLLDARDARRDLRSWLRTHLPGGCQRLEREYHLLLEGARMGAGPEVVQQRYVTSDPPHHRAIEESPWRQRDRP
jgi:hypothetical protein